MLLASARRRVQGTKPQPKQKASTAPAGRAYTLAMAEVDDATVAARTKEILETDEAIKTQYGDGSLTVKTLRKAVAAALGAEESSIKKVVKSTLLAYMDEQEPQEEEEAAADEEEEAEPAPKKEKKKKAKRTDRLTDKAALDAKLKEDNWQITEKPRPTKEGGAKPSRHVDKYYKKPGESKQYRSCLLYTSPSPRDATLSRMPSSA